MQCAFQGVRVECGISIALCFLEMGLLIVLVFIMGVLCAVESYILCHGVFCVVVVVLYGGVFLSIIIPS